MMFTLGLKKLFAIVMTGLMSGCASGPRINTDYTAISQDSRAQFLILHYTAVDFAGSLNELSRGPVSAHYLVNESPPTIYQLVDENHRAYHAGRSSWQGQTMLNAASIGIEIVNLGYQETTNGRVWFEFAQPQIDTVIALVRDIVQRHGIKPERILGHHEIAPQRKQDPGPRFPWKQLADAGLIAWPDADLVALKKIAYTQQLPDTAWFQEKLAIHGYAVPRHGEFDEATRNVIASFQMRYRPAVFDGVPDADTAALLEVVINSR